MTDLDRAMFSAPEMAEAFSGRALVQRMLEVEAALARASAQAGLLPSAAAAAIAAQCRADLFDLDALFAEAAAAGTPAIPLVRMLTERVDPEARRFVHWGATSQDVIDTAVMLQVKDGLALLEHDLRDIGRTCADLAETYRHTPMAGRTLLQHAVPITFGLKAARWLAMVTRLIERLHALRGTLVVQLGGAAGTLAPFGDKGLEVMARLAEALRLQVPDLPWHAERDRVAEIAGALGAIATAMAKIAGDLLLLAQTEVAEVTAKSSPSSAMPHKRNPIDPIKAVACARLATAAVSEVLAATVHEHERAAGGWQAEWPAIPELFRRTSGAVMWTHRALASLRVDAARMRANLALTRGLIMAESLTAALAPHLGWREAFSVVQEACDRAARDGMDLKEVAAVDVRIRAVLPPEQIEQALDAGAYLGSTDALIDRALARYRALRQEAGTRA